MPSDVRHVDGVRRDLAVGPAEATFDAEHARHAEAPDVGVEHAHGEPARRERRGEVHGDRRLADATLAARDGDDPRGGRHLGGRGVLPRVPPGPLHGRGLLLGGHLAVLHGDRGDAGKAAHLRLDVLLDLGAERAPGRGQRDPDHDGAVGRHPDVVDHAQLDDVGVELGIDDAAEHAADVVGRGRRPGHGLVDGSAGIVGVRDGQRHGFLD